jgi:hypothetical protein
MTSGARDDIQGVPGDEVVYDRPPGAYAMSILERSASPQAPVAEWRPHSDRLRVVTAGRVGNMEARLGASGFEVVAVAETEDALIDAVSADEPDAIVVEADLCASLEHVRDLAPDAVLIVVGDHTPAGALGRIERGVSGTAMAGLLHALVAEGVGAAVVWGLVPSFRPRAALHVPERISGSLLSAKADLVRAFVANVGDHAGIVTAASTVAVTVSASLLLTLGAARTHERPERVLVPAPAVERAPQHPVVAVSPTTRTPAHGPSAHGPSGNEGELGDRQGPNGGQSGDHGRHDDQGENEDDQGEDENADDQGEDEDGDDQGEDEDGDDQGEGEDGDDQGEDENADDQGEDGDDQGEDADDQGDNENANDDQGDSENANDDQGDGGPDDDQGDGGNSQD